MIENSKPQLETTPFGPGIELPLSINPKISPFWRPHFATVDYKRRSIVEPHYLKRGESGRIIFELLGDSQIAEVEVVNAWMDAALDEVARRKAGQEPAKGISDEQLQSALTIGEEHLRRHLPTAEDTVRIMRRVEEMS